MDNSAPHPPEVPPARPRELTRPANGLALTALMLIGLYLCCRLALPFLPALSWALALAIVLSPLQRRLESKLKRPNLATAISLAVTAVIVVLPVIFIASRLITEISKGAELIQARAAAGTLTRFLHDYPQLAPLEGWIEQQQIDLSETVGTLGTWLTTTATSFLRGSVMQLTGLLLTFYLLFYFLRDRHLALDSLRSLAPLSSTETDCLFDRVTTTIHATVYGTLVVAMIQGTLGGLMFWLLGLPAPLLWGLVMGLLAIIPLLGAFVIWVPAALWLASQGMWGKALALTAWGAIVVGGIDNLIYPILVGNRLHQHTIIAFISLVGGLIFFGSSGIILGPLSVTLTLLLLEIWHDRKPA
jgi:predicted PurR-regulated permease PerM